MEVGAGNGLEGMGYAESTVGRGGAGGLGSAMVLFLLFCFCICFADAFVSVLPLFPSFAFVLCSFCCSNK